MPPTLQFGLLLKTQQGDGTEAAAGGGPQRAAAAPVLLAHAAHIAALHGLAAPDQDEGRQRRLRRVRPHQDRGEGEAAGEHQGEPGLHGLPLALLLRLHVAAGQLAQSGAQHGQTCNTWRSALVDL